MGGAFYPSTSAASHARTSSSLRIAIVSPARPARTCCSTRPIPVDWYPWGEEALELARRENKPILLSIGYSACHWCHVMAHESFEDPASAAVMNELFVNIKVDREERPDLDQIYQLAHQMLTQRGGGWPLTMFLSPRRPAAVLRRHLFPEGAALRHAGVHRPAAAGARVLSHAARRTSRSRAKRCSRRSMRCRRPPRRRRRALTLAAARHGAREARRASSTRSSAASARRRSFRIRPTSSSCCANGAPRRRSDAPDLHSLYMATLTLHAHGRRRPLRPARRRLRALLGRPVLDDSALREDAVRQRSAAAHLRATRRSRPAMRCSAASPPKPPTGSCATCSRPAAATGRRSMRTRKATKASSTSGTRPKCARCCRRRVYEVFARRFGLDREPNFEGQLAPARVPLRGRDRDRARHRHGRSASDASPKRASTLLRSRNARIWPGRDEKILTSWNGLAIAGMAVAARALGRPDLAESATRAVDFIREHLWRDGRLLAVHKDGQSRFAAYLDDYAFLLDGLLELLQTRWRSADLQFAIGARRRAAGAFRGSRARRLLLHRRRSRSADASLASRSATKRCRRQRRSPRRR